MSTANVPATDTSKSRTLGLTLLNFFAGNPVRLTLSCVVLVWVPLLVSIYRYVWC